MSATADESSTVKTILSAVGSVATALLVVRGITRPEFQDYLISGSGNLFKRLSTHLTIVIDEFCTASDKDELYEAAEIYLGSKTCTANTCRFKAQKPESENMKLAMEPGECVIDYYHGAKFTWTWICKEKQAHHEQCAIGIYVFRSFEVSFNKKHKQMAVESYLPCVLKQGKALKQETRVLKMFTLAYQIYANSTDCWWSSTGLGDSITFDMLVIEPMVFKDLERFVNMREKFRKMGKAWKRGYLLYGPPGAGKSSLIAAMANYLKFDIYNMELTRIKYYSVLQQVLTATTNCSLVVVKDFDLLISQDQVALAPGASKENEVTLSGLLDWIDGLWSSTQDEGIVVFTTTRKLEKNDPAIMLLQKCIDMDINLPYCTSSSFKLVAEKYLGIDEHWHFHQIEKLIETVEVTPAEVAEQLLKSDETDAAVCCLAEYLRLKDKKNNGTKAFAQKRTGGRR